MNTKITILALLVVMGLVFLSGCTQKETAPTPPVDDGDDTTPGDEDDDTTPGDEDDDTTPGDEDNGSAGSLTQEDLDKLKEAIEGLEVEDLGGLTDE